MTKYILYTIKNIIIWIFPIPLTIILQIQWWVTLDPLLYQIPNKPHVFLQSIFRSWILNLGGFRSYRWRRKGSMFGSSSYQVISSIKPSFISWEEGSTCWLEVYTMGCHSIKTIYRLHEGRELQHLVPWISWCIPWDHPHVECYVSGRLYSEHLAGDGGVISCKLRSNATKHAKLDPTSYVSHLKSHQCIYTHTNIRHEQKHYTFISIIYQKVQFLLKLWGTHSGHIFIIVSLCEANMRANHSHRVNFNGSNGGRGLNGKVKGKILSYMWTIICKVT